jgi:endonuclease/exonuclease/phosphatase family metal-dependent hydrolase
VLRPASTPVLAASELARRPFLWDHLPQQPPGPVGQHTQGGSMRIATFNVENLFRRASALNQPSWEDGEPILVDYYRFGRLIAKPGYSEADKAELVTLLKRYDLHTRNAAQARFFLLREVRGRLFKLPRGTQTPEIVAGGRADWDGWLELKRDDIGSTAIENTARVIHALDADVLAVVEAEDRIALELFNTQVLARYGADYRYNMLIDGNDTRGIDVGLYSRYPIVSLRSNIDAGPPGAPIFSRDCPEYEIELPGGKSLWVLVNHFKSKGYGSAAASNARRRAQAEEVARICRERHARHRYLVVAGDLNDTPDSAALAPLLRRTGLRDAMTHPTYTRRADARPGTYASGSKSGKLDYLLLSPALWAKLRDVDVERRGVWAPRTFPHFDTVTGALDAASDHAAIWADIAI